MGHFTISLATALVAVVEPQAEADSFVLASSCWLSHGAVIHEVGCLERTASQSFSFFAHQLCQMLWLPLDLPPPLDTLSCTRQSSRCDALSWFYRSDRTFYNPFSCGSANGSFTCAIWSVFSICPSRFVALYRQRRFCSGSLLRVCRCICPASLSSAPRTSATIRSCCPCLSKNCGGLF